MVTTGISPHHSEAPGRVIDVEGCFNFRDMGGYLTSDGRSVRWRSLFRADGLYRLTRADLDQLGALGLRTVIDLRTHDELTDRGRIQWPSADLGYHHLPMMDVVPTHDHYATWVRPNDIAREYSDMLSSGWATITRALQILSDPASYPAVYHCMAGKDRTGILSALILGFLGVSDEDIVADYALSGNAMVRMLEWLTNAAPETATTLAHRATAILAAEPETMAAFLHQFREDYGSFGDYGASLGLSGLAKRLRELLLEPCVPLS